MTLPSAQISPVVQPTTASVPMASPASVEFPIQWILDSAAAPIQYRAITEVAKLGSDAKLLSVALAYPPAILLALTQSPDGIWNRSMLGVPSPSAKHFEGVGTINAVRRLLEYGWDKDTPPVLHSRRILFRLLAEDDDPAFLFELAGSTPDGEQAQRGRAVLREAAAAVLAQSGYEGDPRLRGAARRILARIDDFLSSPLAEKPWIRVGNKQVLAEEAEPPSLYALMMLAYMPLFRIEHHSAIERIYKWLSQPLPRQESQQQYGKQILSQPQLVLGDMLPHRNAVDADVPFALSWLELIARLGFMRRNENWSRLFDRFLDDRNRDFIWHPHKGLAMPQSINPLVWSAFPLEAHAEGEDRWTDVTFRLGLIARLAGRQIELV